MHIFDFFLFFAAILSSSIAAVAGFGIGSILTPLLALKTGTKVAVFLIAIPHFLATGIRFWMVRSHLNKPLLLHFGLLSATGGLAGAILHSFFQSKLLSAIFSLLLMIAGLIGFADSYRKLRFDGPVTWIAGLLSGIFGGLVGNQGGLRSIALLSFNLQKNELIATGTSVALLVDTARLPIYLYTGSSHIRSSFQWVLLITLGTLIGTYIGVRFLHRFSEHHFRKVISLLIFLLGAYTLFSHLIS